MLNLSTEGNENVTVNYQGYTYDFCVANLAQKEIISSTFNYKLKIKNIKALVEAPVNQKTWEEYFKKYASDN